MPSVRTHDKYAAISSAIVAPISTIAWVATGSTLLQAVWYTTIFVGTHLICSYWLSPDLDIDSSIDNRWGPLGILWKPYEKAVPHRHWLSHSGLSVLLRLLYIVIHIIIILLLVELLVDGVFRRTFAWSVEVVQTHPIESMLFLAGAIFSDALHTITDVMSTRLKRKKRKKRKK